MGIYVILDIEVHNREKYREYQKQVPSIIKKYGGRYVVRGGDIISLGEWKPDRVVVLEFPSMHKLQEFIGSPEYAQIKPVRDESATFKIIAVNGCVEDFPKT